MKLTNKLCGAVLLATLGVAVAVPGITKADNTTFTGDMDIQFTRNTGDDTDTTRPKLTDSDGNSDTDIESGSVTRPIRPAIFGIQDVTPLSFGMNAVVTDGNDRVFWAKNYTEKEAVMANNVLIKDVRSTLNHNYTLTAQITKPMTTTVKDGEESQERTLSGATLLYRNIGRKTNVAEEIALPTSAVKTSAEVTEASAVTIVDNTGSNKDQGQGQTYIHFGKTNATGEESSEKSVKLTVGKDKTIFEGNYKGEVTWVLTAAK
ncbi:hypothetical protein A5821_002191 [Enterococcus sp. 7F3_DIV0205]|uniref:WxL domain-containing protein n=1 Tax=Candidatus Enterococcus palustris TaxID=1834189 RepID=A0AAQ3W989_9ENTE|nr:WxL domain-containing protein [Enterococcus sp. 7F3_DIV0205]OTN82630.1 hypothetical protein A5821_002541 [Enterococcus sp. 7F3_DIV0205]